jgi:sulfate transport system permease protein
MAAKRYNPLPGFNLTMGCTIFYLSVIVLIPIGGLFLKVLDMSWGDFWRLATTERAMAAYKLTFGASLVAALVNAVFGTIAAWVLVRYQFPGKRFFDAMVDFPFALPTAVTTAGLENSSCRWGLRALLPGWGWSSP